MIWNDLEKSFLHAAAHSFARRKLLLTFSALALCGIFIVFCRAVALESSPWISMSLIFLPILLSSGFLLSLGVLLIRMYMHERKGLFLSLGRLFAGSFDVMIGTSYLSLPPVLLYLLLWIVLGFFLLLKEIPLIGPFFNVVLAFGPFLLIFSSMLLCLVNLGLLFFIAPAAAHQSVKRIDLAKRVGLGISGRPLSALVLLLIALFPALLIGGLLSLCVWLTSLSFCVQGPPLAIALEWFFVMLPFCALLSPAVVFFFQFAAESYLILERK